MLAIHQQANSVFPSIPRWKILISGARHLAVLRALQPAVLNPDLGLLDVMAHVNDSEGGQDAEPQHAAPADSVEEEAVDHARQQQSRCSTSLADTPLMKPRERCGQVSMAKAAPAGHSAPMPMPSNVRKISRNTKLGENPAMKLQTEYQKIEIISGVLRPIRSASQPEPTAPTSRIHKVSVKTMATSVVGTWNSSRDRLDDQ